MRNADQIPSFADPFLPDKLLWPAERTDHFPTDNGRAILNLFIDGYYYESLYNYCNNVHALIILGEFDVRQMANPGSKYQRLRALVRRYESNPDLMDGLIAEKYPQHAGAYIQSAHYFRMIGESTPPQFDQATFHSLIRRRDKHVRR